MSAAMRIVNGKVYDPANNIDGKIKEICIQDGKIVDSVPEDATVIDAQDANTFCRTKRACCLYA